MLITRRSPFSGIEHTRDINITQEQLNYCATRHEPIQDILPMLSEDDREFLISGITPEEWEAAFPPEDEEV